MTAANRKRILQLLIVVLCAAALKIYYSSANVNDLRWILAPTTASVELVTGTSFEFESYAGYIKSDKNFLIAASCSGMNFLIAAFLLLSFGTLWRNRYRSLRWRFIPIAGVIAYVTTILANTVRISSALRLQEVPAETGLFDDAQLHRIEGIVVYFGFLLLLYFITTKMYPERKPASRSDSSLLRGSLLPLLIYYATALGLPFLNGAYSQGAVFWEHVLFVLVTPLLVLLPFAAFSFIIDRRTTFGSLAEIGKRLQQ